MPLNKANIAYAADVNLDLNTLKSDDSPGDASDIADERSYLLHEQLKEQDNKVDKAAEPISTMMDKEVSFAPPTTPPRQIDIKKPPPALKSPALKSPTFMSPDFLANKIMKMSVDDDASATHSATPDDSVAPSTKASEAFEMMRKQDGSRSRPYISSIDLNTPELSRDFEGQYCASMERNGWRRPGIHVRRVINNLDVGKWSAEMPEKDEFPEYEGRSFLVKRPALDACMRDPNLYHKKKRFEDVKQVHKNHVSKHDWVYHLIVVNEGIELENAHFAGEQTHVIQTQYNPIKLDKHEHEYGCSLRLLYAYWEIAFSSGGLKIYSDGAEGSVNMKNFYD